MSSQDEPYCPPRSQEKAGKVSRSIAESDEELGPWL
jgi:hypothetical protein